LQRSVQQYISLLSIFEWQTNATAPVKKIKIRKEIKTKKQMRGNTMYIYIYTHDRYPKPLQHRQKQKQQEQQQQQQQQIPQQHQL
jgi:ABC-type transporter lipoprotein component MlaA